MSRQQHSFLSSPEVYVPQLQPNTSQVWCRWEPMGWISSEACWGICEPALRILFASIIYLPTPLISSKYIPSSQMSLLVPLSHVCTNHSLPLIAVGWLSEGWSDYVCERQLMWDKPQIVLCSICILAEGTEPKPLQTPSPIDNPLSRHRSQKCSF